MGFGEQSRIHLESRIGGPPGTVHRSAPYTPGYDEGTRRGVARGGGCHAGRLAADGRGMRPSRGRPNIRRADEWCAWARGPDKERVEGRGDSPEGALLELTAHLEGLSH